MGKELIFGALFQSGSGASGTSRSVGMGMRASSSSPRRRQRPSPLQEVRHGSPPCPFAPATLPVFLPGRLRAAVRCF